MRLLHLMVIGTLLFAAAYVYRIKMESTVRTERVMQLRADLRKEREEIAALRANGRGSTIRTPAGAGAAPYAAASARCDPVRCARQPAGQAAAAEA